MQKECLHCGEVFYPEDGSENFCCLGCGSAYLLINSLNLGKYYDYCKNLYNKSPMKVNKVINELDYSAHVLVSESSNKIQLLIEGIHCGACVWLIENSLSEQESVLAAKVNLSTKKLTLEWSGDVNYIYKLISTLEDLGYRGIPFTGDDLNAEQKRVERQLLKSMIIAGIVSMQVMMIIIGVWAGGDSMGQYSRLVLHIFAALITIPAVIYSGMPFFKSAWTAVKAKRSNMDVPISIGVIASTIISIKETISGGAHTYYDAAISLLFILLIGRYLDVRIRNKASREAYNLILSQPRSVTICDNDNRLRLVDISKAQVGQVALISSGERVPVDGVIIEGQTEIDNSIITGETIPISAKEGMQVFAGSVNIGTSIKVMISKSSDNTLLNEIVKLIESAEQRRGKYVVLADRVSAYYTPVVLALSILTFCIWNFLFSLPFNQALLTSISVLIVTCPCALALAVPVVQIIAALTLMKKGILIKSSDALERLVQVDIIVLDKTGTITEGKPKFINKNDFSGEELKIIASLASQSKHILLNPIKESYDGPIYDLEVIEEKGSGLKAILDGMEVRLGNRQWCNVKGSPVDSYLEMWLKINNKIKRIILSDKIRDKSLQVIRILKKIGFNKILVLSGDNEESVKRVADSIEIEYYESMLKPQEKYYKIRELQREGGRVFMVGDGLNDSAALCEAFASASFSSGLAITQNNADIIFQNDLDSIIDVIEIAKKARKLAKQNIFMSLAYNAVMIPVAMFGFITPLIAAVAMAASSMLVTLNSMRLNIK